MQAPHNLVKHRRQKMKRELGVEKFQKNRSHLTLKKQVRSSRGSRKLGKKRGKRRKDSLLGGARRSATWGGLTQSNHRSGSLIERKKSKKGRSWQGHQQEREVETWEREVEGDYNCEVLAQTVRTSRCKCRKGKRPRDIRSACLL